MHQEHLAHSDLTRNVLQTNSRARNVCPIQQSRLFPRQTQRSIRSPKGMEVPRRRG